MKKLIGLLTILSLGLLIISCDSTEVPVSTTKAKGNIYITSQPDSAEIWLDNVNTSLVTPDTVENVDEGIHSITLKLTNYRDTTFSVSVTGDQTIIWPNVELSSSIGNIFLTSNPAGAQIWLDDVTTTLTTPDTIKDVEEGVHNITLKLQDYYDTTFAISVTVGQTSVAGPIVLVSNILITLYGTVTIYETAGTLSLPSGLDLSSGKPWGVISDSSGLVDIYYSSTGFLIQSAHLYPNLARETYFFVGTNNNIFDGEDSPLRNTGTWTDNILDSETNYVFLYDHDGHYSKLKIISTGGGTPNNPAWVRVQWYYNETMLDNRF